MIHPDKIPAGMVQAYCQFTGVVEELGRPRLAIAIEGLLMDDQAMARATQTFRRMARDDELHPMRAALTAAVQESS